MNRGWFIAAAVAALALGACAGGPGAAPAGPSSTPIPSPPSLSVLGYALQSGGRSTPRVLDEYPVASTSSARSFQELGGAAIRFDPSGTLWSDQIGSFVGYRSDGSNAGMMNPQDQLLAFDVRGIAADRAGNAYVVTRPSASNFSAPRTLLYFAAGTGTAVTLQSGQIGSVAAVP
jgi:hypothetical protein